MKPVKIVSQVGGNDAACGCSSCPCADAPKTRGVFERNGGEVAAAAPIRITCGCSKCPCADSKIQPEMREHLTGTWKGVPQGIQSLQKQKNRAKVKIIRGSDLQKENKAQEMNALANKASAAMQTASSAAVSASLAAAKTVAIASKLTKATPLTSSSPQHRAKLSALNVQTKIVDDAVVASVKAAATAQNSLDQQRRLLR